MKAIRAHEFGPPSVMRIEEIPAPTPGPRQLLIAIRAAGETGSKRIAESEIDDLRVNAGVFRKTRRVPCAFRIVH